MGNSATPENNEQLIHPPKPNDRTEITQLAYLNSYDAIVDKDYAYVAYKEENKETGKWLFKIKAKVTAGTSIDPGHPTIRSKIAEAAKKGEQYFIMGFNMTPQGNDPRLVENRVYFDESLKPIYIEIHLITRKEDGSPTDEQVVKIEWPGVGEDTPEEQVVSPPKSTDSSEITQLAYLNSYDVITNKDYAYAAYKEVNQKTAKWLFKIKANVTAGTSIDPEHPSFKNNIKAAAKKGESYINMGFKMMPKDGDPRHVENRVYFDDSHYPTCIEIHLVTRNADNSPTDKQLVKIDWPT